MVFLSKNAKKYFKKAQDEVFDWWNPERRDMSIIYKHGLDRAIEELRKYKEVKYILDIGCGKGRVTKILSSYYNVVAIDISKRMVNYVQNLNLSNVKVLVGDSEALPLEAVSMDAIICLETLVHFSNLNKVFSEFYRVLKPGSICIVNIDNAYGYIRILKTIIDRIIYIFDRQYKKERQRRLEFFKPLIPRVVQKTAEHNSFVLIKKIYIGTKVPFKLKNITIISQKLFKYIFNINRILEKMPILNLGSTYIYYVFRKK